MQYHQTPSYFIALHQQKTRQQPEEGDGSAGSSRAGEGADRLTSEPAEQCGARYRSGRQQQQTVVEGRSATVGQLSREVAGQLAHEQDRLSTGQLTRGLNRQTVRQLTPEFDRESAGQLTRGLGSVTAGQLTHEVTRAPCVASSEPARPPAVGQEHAQAPWLPAGAEQQVKLPLASGHKHVELPPGTKRQGPACGEWVSLARTWQLQESSENTGGRLGQHTLSEIKKPSVHASSHHNLEKKVTSGQDHCRLQSLLGKDARLSSKDILAKNKDATTRFANDGHIGQPSTDSTVIGNLYSAGYSAGDLSFTPGHSAADLSSTPGHSAGDFSAVPGHFAGDPSSAPGNSVSPPTYRKEIP